MGKRIGLVGSAFAGALALGVGVSGDDVPRPLASVTVYSSFPLQGAQRTLAEGTINGIRLALEESGYRAGAFKVRYRSLDDSSAELGRWDPGQTAANARRAAEDPEAVAYIGEFNSGASATSIPILNDAGVPQVSPGNTAVGLTSKGAGAGPGEPERYYPTGRRTYLRIVPKDTVQGAALARAMVQERCKNVFLLNDGELYGVGLARNVEVSGERLGLTILGNRTLDPKAANYGRLAARIARRGARCVAFAGITPNNAVQVFRDLAAGVPGAKLFGPDGVAESSFADAREGGIKAAVAARTLVTAPTLEPSAYPRSGQRFFAAYRRRYGSRDPEPYAIYGYEAMRLVLDAISGAGTLGARREAVLERLMSTRNRRSVLGTYSIDRNGDTSLTDYGIYRIVDGALRFVRPVKGGTGSADGD